MVQKKHSRRYEASRVAEKAASRADVARVLGGGRGKQKLEIVLKCDSFGTCEAVGPLIKSLKSPEVEVDIIHSGVGSVSKNDLLMALTGSKLLIGFNIGLAPKLDQWIKEQGVEVRLYNVIYRLTEDLQKIAQSLTAVPEPEEKILGRGRVIALFKSSHKGVILGCEVIEGTLIAGKEFRIIAAMGPVYNGRIESLQSERTTIKEAGVGRQVGLKVQGFNRAKIGDLVECYETHSAKKSARWEPSGNVLHMES